jgi:hypothetical protein
VIPKGIIEVKPAKMESITNAITPSVCANVR